MRLYQLFIPCLLLSIRLVGQILPGNEEQNDQPLSSITTDSTTTYVPSDLIIKFPLSFPDEVNQGVILTGDCRKIETLTGHVSSASRCVFSVGPDGRERWRTELPFYWSQSTNRLLPAGEEHVLMTSDASGSFCLTFSPTDLYLLNRTTGIITDLNPADYPAYSDYSPYRPEAVTSFLVDPSATYLYYVWDGLRRWTLGAAEDAVELVTPFMNIPAEINKVAVAWLGSEYVLLLENELLTYDLNTGATRQIALENTASDLKVFDNEVYLITGEELHRVAGEQTNFLHTIGTAIFADSDRSLLLFDAASGHAREYDPTTNTLINDWPLNTADGLPVSVATLQNTLQVTRRTMNSTFVPFGYRDRAAVYQTPISTDLPPIENPIDVELVSLQQDSLAVYNDHVFLEYLSGTIRNNGDQILRNVVLFHSDVIFTCDFWGVYRANRSVFIDSLDIAPGETGTFTATFYDGRPVDIFDAESPYWFCLNYPNFTTDADPNNNCIQFLLSDIEDELTAEQLKVFPNPTS
ncbi:MAG: hypothetical protein AAF828_03650, partial [Bacteroidota bacterium]